MPVRDTLLVTLGLHFQSDKPAPVSVLHLPTSMSMINTKLRQRNDHRHLMSMKIIKRRQKEKIIIKRRRPLADWRLPNQQN